MTVEGARTQVKGLEAAFSAALEESIPTLHQIVHVIEHGGNGDIDPATVAEACRLTIRALSSLQDMAMVWHAATAVMTEVEA